MKCSPDVAKEKIIQTIWTKYGW